MAYTNDFVSIDPSTFYANMDATSDKDLLKERDKRALGVLPYELLQNYNKIAQGGIYGEEGMTKMNAASRAAAAFRTRMLMRAAMQGGAASRLGSRSGAFQTFLANRVYAPYLAEDAQSRRDILRENLLSRLQGLQGAGGIMEFLQGRTNEEWWKKGSQKSIGDVVSGLARTGLSVGDLFVRGKQAEADASIGTGLSEMAKSRNRQFSDPFENE